MCEQCHQPDWFCQNTVPNVHRTEYGSKQIKSEKTGTLSYSILSLDFSKRSIVMFDHENKKQMVIFPDNWDALSLEEKKDWLLTVVRALHQDVAFLREQLIQVKTEMKLPQ